MGVTVPLLGLDISHNKVVILDLNTPSGDKPMEVLQAIEKLSVQIIIIIASFQKFSFGSNMIITTSRDNFIYFYVVLIE